MQFLPPLNYGLVVFAHMHNAAYILDVGSVVTVKVPVVHVHVLIFEKLLVTLLFFRVLP